MLASYPSEATEATLNCDVDLVATNDFAPLAALTTATFDGKKHIVENMKITHTAKAGELSVGMFASITDAATVKNLTIKNVSLDLTEVTGDAPINHSAVGALAGTVSGAATITEVALDGGSLEVSGSDAAAVGGLIGELSATTGTVAITGHTNAGTEDPLKYTTVSLTKIKGHNYLGGIIGKISGAATVSITQYASQITGFEILNKADVAKVTAPVYGTVGTYIGTVNAASTITIGAAAEDGWKAMTDCITTKRAALGFKNNYGGTDNAYSFIGKSVAVGYSPNFTKITIAGTDYSSKDADNVADKAAVIASAKLNVFVKDDKYTAADTVIPAE